MGMKWNGVAIYQQIHDEMERRIKACCILVHNHWRMLTNQDGTARAARAITVVKRDGTTRKLRKGAWIYGANPSAAGEPPHKQTGQLLQSEDWEVDNLIGRVGSNLKKLLWLEFGTKYMKARPSLRRALAEKRAEIKAILTKPMKL
jgi:hypothetical protein